VHLANITGDGTTGIVVTTLGLVRNVLSRFTNPNPVIVESTPECGRTLIIRLTRRHAELVYHHAHLRLLTHVRVLRTGLGWKWTLLPIMTNEGTISATTKHLALITAWQLVASFPVLQTNEIASRQVAFDRTLLGAGRTFGRAISGVCTDLGIRTGIVVVAKQPTLGAGYTLLALPGTSSVQLTEGQGLVAVVSRCTMPLLPRDNFTDCTFPAICICTTRTHTYRLDVGTRFRLGADRSIVGAIFGTLVNHWALGAHMAEAIAAGIDAFDFITRTRSSAAVAGFPRSQTTDTPIGIGASNRPLLRTAIAGAIAAFSRWQTAHAAVVIGANDWLLRWTSIGVDFAITVCGASLTDGTWLVVVTFRPTLGVLNAHALLIATNFLFRTERTGFLRWIGWQTNVLLSVLAADKCLRAIGITGAGLRTE
jgi:hypothetical protein